MFTRLANAINRLTYDFLLLDPAGHLPAAVNFFLYDSIKIIILLIGIVVLMTFLNSYLPIQKIRDFLHKNKLF